MESIKRSVDSLQKIYAVIVALAIGETVKKAFKDVTTLDNIGASLEGVSIPALLSFFIVIVPFYHGMNRHLDLCYLERKDTTLHGGLILDFLIFCIEASILFVFSSFLHSGIESFIILGILLLVDILWSSISYLLHYRGFAPSVLNWVIINLVTLFLGYFIYVSNFTDAKEWSLFVIALARTILDYALCWRFYFPTESIKPSKKK